MMDFIRAALYNLKREYGGPAALTRSTPSGTDPATGTKSSTPQVFNILKVIRLPNQISLNNPFAAAFKHLPNTGASLVGARQFIIDGADITIVPRRDDYLEFGGDRYNINDVESLDDNLGFMISATMVKQ